MVSLVYVAYRLSWIRKGLRSFRLPRLILFCPRPIFTEWKYVCMYNLFCSHALQLFSIALIGNHRSHDQLVRWSVSELAPWTDVSTAYFDGWINTMKLLDKEKTVDEAPMIKVFLFTSLLHLCQSYVFRILKVLLKEKIFFFLITKYFVIFTRDMTKYNKNCAFEI